MQNSGILSVKVKYANLERNIDFFNTMDPYTLINFGGQTKRTKVCKQGGKNPIWNETLTFQRSDEHSFKITVYDEDPGEDEVVASTIIYFDNVMQQGHIKDTYVLNWQGIKHGSIILEMDWQPENGQYEQQQAVQQFQSCQYKTDRRAHRQQPVQYQQQQQSAINQQMSYWYQTQQQNLKMQEQQQYQQQQLRQQQQQQHQQQQQQQHHQYQYQQQQQSILQQQPQQKFRRACFDPINSLIQEKTRTITQKQASIAARSVNLSLNLSVNRSHIGNLSIHSPAHQSPINNGIKTQPSPAINRIGRILIQRERAPSLNHQISISKPLTNSRMFTQENVTTTPCLPTGAQRLILPVKQTTINLADFKVISTQNNIKQKTPRRSNSVTRSFKVFDPRDSSCEIAERVVQQQPGISSIHRRVCVGSVHLPVGIESIHSTNGVQSINVPTPIMTGGYDNQQ